MYVIVDRWISGKLVNFFSYIVRFLIVNRDTLHSTEHTLQHGVSFDMIG